MGLVQSSPDHPSLNQILVYSQHHASAGGDGVWKGEQFELGCWISEPGESRSEGHLCWGRIIWRLSSRIESSGRLESICGESGGS